MELSTAHPIKVTGVEVEELSGGQTEAVFTFAGGYSVTEPLYEELAVIDQGRVLSLTIAAEAAGLPNSVFVDSDAMATVESMKAPENFRRVLKIVTPEGSRGKFSGKAKARLNNDGSWAFQVLDISGLALDGRKAPDGKYVVDGTADGEKYIANLEAALNAFEEQLNRLTEKYLADKKVADAALAASAKEAEEKMRVKAEAEAAEATAREAAFLAALAEGQVYLGRWQGKVSHGEIGVKFGKSMKMGHGYSFVGILFDPATPANQKGFSALSAGDGTDQSPYRLEFRLERGQGVPIPKTSEYQATRNSTVGLLYDEMQYTLPLELAGDMRALSGTVGPSFRNTIGPAVPIVFQLTKDYVPEVTAAAPSGGMGVVESSHKKMTLEEMNERVAASSESYDAFSAALANKDGVASRAFLQQMQVQNPSSPQTYRAGILMAAIDKDVEAVTSIHRMAAETFSVDEQGQVGWDAMRDEALKFIKNFPGPPSF